MAWGYYLNMEELSAEIAEEALSKMSNSNYQEIDNEIKTDNGDEFITNLKWGATAVVMICCYVESSINTLLRDFLGYSPDGEVIKSSIETKLEVIFSNQPDQLKLIRGDNCWDKFMIIKFPFQLFCNSRSKTVFTNKNSRFDSMCH